MFFLEHGRLIGKKERITIVTIIDSLLFVWSLKIQSTEHFNRES